MKLSCFIWFYLGAARPVIKKCACETCTAWCAESPFTQRSRCGSVCQITAKRNIFGGENYLRFCPTWTLFEKQLCMTVKDSPWITTICLAIVLSWSGPEKVTCNQSSQLRPSRYPRGHAIKLWALLYLWQWSPPATFPPGFRQAKSMGEAGFVLTTAWFT